MGTRDERVLDYCWIDQTTPVVRPVEQGFGRSLDGTVWWLDVRGLYTPRHAYTEHVYSLDVSVPATMSMIAHDFELADGVEIFVEDGGELLVL